MSVGNFKKNKPSEPMTPPKAMADAIVDGLGDVAADGKEIAEKAKTYTDILAENNISLDEAARIVEAVIITGVYTETVNLTKSVTVEFRSRSYADTQRYLAAVEAYQPRYVQERDEISMRYFLAASIARYKETTFTFADDKDLAAAKAAFEERHTWLMCQPEVLIRLLAAKLHHFDKKLAVCTQEGVIENF